MITVLCCAAAPNVVVAAYAHTYAHAFIQNTLNFIKQILNVLQH
ncbi:hypothetical protein DOY81_013544 [Sarcophaga bullata]|nr:hypothetical protein DOY81_013544 [Sarcophaga bullata]